MKNSHNSNLKNAQTTYEFILGPIKVKDGLFMGDELAAKDIEFIISNKVTHVINTVSKVIPNMWERFGIQYISVNWSEKQQNIFDRKNNVVNEIFHFIEEAMQQGQSCLIHSVNGKSRASCVLIAYLMKKYCWSLSKCLQFIRSKKDHLEIKPNFMTQLHQLQKRMSQIYNLTSDWDECKNEEDIMIRNTYRNSKMLKIDSNSNKVGQTNKKKVQWGQKHIINNQSNRPTNTSAGISCGKDTKTTQQYPVKSILKGYNNDQQVYNKSANKQTSNHKKPQQSQYQHIKDNNFINSIKSNFVQVTVNNFITGAQNNNNISSNANVNTNNEKNKFDANRNNHPTYINSRPFSSDNKQRDNTNIIDKNKMFPYNNLINSNAIYGGYKSPYDIKVNSNKSSTNSHNKINRKKDDMRIISYERPQSANITSDKKKMKNIINNKQREDIVVMGKKRYPSTNPRDEFYKWK